MNSLLKIENLTINNFATIKNQHVEFSDGFNVIVGETGSGKSLILDALQLTFGARADKKIVRKGSKFSTVEVSFSVDINGFTKISDFCEELGFPMDDNIHIKRVIYKEGNSKAFLNHQSCPLSILNKFTRKFIDLVGQFENQKLLSPEYQLKLVDSYASLSDDFKRYSEVFLDLKRFEKELNSLEERFSNRERERDYLEFQLNEFEALNPSPEEEERLIEEKELLLNAGKNEAIANEYRFLLFEENDGGLLSKFKNISNKIISSSFSNTDEMANKVNLIESTLYEIDDMIRATNSSGEDSEQKLEGIIDLLDRYQQLKRKFNIPTDQLQEKNESLTSELKKLLNIESSLSSLKEKVAHSKELCLNLALDLHKNRVSASKNLSKELTKAIQKLNMEGATIKFLCSENSDLSSTGLTKLEVAAETNPGEGFFNLSTIASGGELSRILLSLRHLMTSQDSISVFLFDEIDTGIGGKTALKIGQMLKEISCKSQVIAITHLPQIASAAECLIAVEKEMVDSRTESKIYNYQSNEMDDYITEMNQIN